MFLIAGMTKLMLIPIGVALLIALFVATPIIADVLDDVRTDAASESVGCTTAVGATTCVITLSNPHAYSTSQSLTVTETSPGSGAKTTSVSRTDRTQITVSGLTGATTYVFTASYLVLASGLTNDQGDLLKWTPFALLLGGFGLLGWIMFSVMRGLSKGIIIIVSLFIGFLALNFLPALQAVTDSISGSTTNPGIAAGIGIAPFVVIILLLGIPALWFVRGWTGGR